MSSEDGRPATTDVQRVEADVAEKRSLVTDVVLPLVPPTVTAVGIGVTHWQNRPEKPEPPKVELPPSVNEE